MKDLIIKTGILILVGALIQGMSLVGYHIGVFFEPNATGWLRELMTVLGIAVVFGALEITAIVTGK